MTKTIIALASDHAGYQLKEHLKQYLTQQNLEIKDFGTHSEESCDYPDFAHPMAQLVINEEDAIGIAICGTGNGINMTVNKYPNIRGALCWKEELALLARSHNNANILALPARFITFEEAEKIVNTFLNTPFEGGRHLRRVNKIPFFN